MGALSAAARELFKIASEGAGPLLALLVCGAAAVAIKFFRKSETLELRCRDLQSSYLDHQDKLYKWMFDEMHRRINENNAIVQHLERGARNTDEMKRLLEELKSSNAELNRQIAVVAAVTMRGDRDAR